MIAGLYTIAPLAGYGAKGDDAKDEKEDKTIRTGVSVTPHTEILKHVKPALEKKGYKVEIEKFTDYVKPNQTLVDGELDANFLQYKPYLIDWAKKANISDKLTNVFTVCFEPLGIYSDNHTSLKEVINGQKISVPNDPINGGCTLKLLADNGIITLKEDKGVGTTKQGIKAYNKKVEITEIQAETCATSLPDVDFVVVNENSTLNAKISDKVLMTESRDSEAAQTYANIITAQIAHKGDEKVEDSTTVLNTEDVKKFIKEKYNGIVIPLIPVNE